MTYKDEKTRPGGQPGIIGTQGILYLQAFLESDIAPTCGFLRERTPNTRQLCHKIGTPLFGSCSPSQGDAA